MKNSALIYLFMILILTASACSGANGTAKEEGSTFKSVQEISEVNPEKPVKIKLKRNGDGEYSWELNGDDVEQVIGTDKRLLQYNKEQKIIKKD
ncbi:MAG: hypothetical protein Q7U10_07070 [Thermodesulfovibrionia bacterium]|nr:hypothetical protein [Thermodesulfovibrionia bacterium]